MSKGTAIITGASQGIGACIAKGLALDGYKVVLISRNIEKLHDLEKEIKNQKKESNIVLIKQDITKFKELDINLSNVLIENEKIAVLVNAAGMWLNGSLTESVDNFEKIIDVNLVAQYAVLKRVVEKMKIQREGYIFNIASRAGKYGFENGGIYGATKFAFVGLSESLYRELSPLGIKVTALCPGWVNTEMAKEAGTPLKKDEMIQPEDILSTIRYLISLTKATCIKEMVFECSKSIL